MFPNLPAAYEAPDDEIVAVATSMGGGAAASDIPAGFTYFGQFVDHDLTFDATGLADAERDPRAVRNFRTPTFDLDSVYGGGPGVSPWLYARPAPGEPTRRLAIGDVDPLNPDAGDLPRRGDGVPLIGDPRNDENLVVAQLHLVFLRFHNRVCTHLEALGTPLEFVFHRAVDIVRWHYQWVVLHDFVRRICRDGLGGDSVLRSVLLDGNRFYLPEGEPWMPIEFSGAAYRFGHSMVRENYAPFNDVFSTASLGQLFTFTGRAGHPGVAGNGWRIRPKDWQSFFEMGGSPAGNLAERIDSFLAPNLLNLPGFPPGPEANLAARNLARGRRFRLPSGQTLANLLGVAPLSPAEVRGSHPMSTEFATRTPLWFYLLREADQRSNGNSLGPVGARILAEVFVGILRADCSSFLHQRLLLPGAHIGVLSGSADGRSLTDLVANESARHSATVPALVEMPIAAPGELPATGRRLGPEMNGISRPWAPFLPSAKPGSFTMADLVAFANS